MAGAVNSDNDSCHLNHLPADRHFWQF
jgi:hypothetical protein